MQIKTIIKIYLFTVSLGIAVPAVSQAGCLADTCCNSSGTHCGCCSHSPDLNAFIIDDEAMLSQVIGEEGQDADFGSSNACPNPLPAGTTCQTLKSSGKMCFWKDDAGQGHACILN